MLKQTIRTWLNALRTIGAMGSVLVSVACSEPTSELPTLEPLTTATERAPLLEARDEEEVVPGEYIVVLKGDRDVAEVRREIATALPEATLRRSWSKVLRGFVITATEQDVERLRTYPDVAYVQPNNVAGPGSTTQTGAPWHLDRLDQLSTSGDGNYTYDYDGSGVTIYIVDSGVRASHDDFGTRASIWYETNTFWPVGVDCLGHGTQVASAAAGVTYGVAKGATIRAVRIDDCTAGAPDAEVIEAFEHIANNATGPAVVSFSYNHTSQAVAEAAEGVIDAGFPLFVLARNDNEDACSDINEVPHIVTVGATDSTNARASFSNYGSCVDIWAPGEAITTADIDSDSDVTTMNGTSYATPIAAGVGAIYLDQFNDPMNKVVHSVVGSGWDPLIANKGTGSPPWFLYSRVPRVTVEPVGPEQVHPDDDCVWTAEARGGRLPYSWSWSGLFSGTNIFVSGTVAAPGGTLTITATDLASNQDQGSIVVASSTSYSQVCPD